MTAFTVIICIYSMPLFEAEICQHW